MLLSGAHNRPRLAQALGVGGAGQLSSSHPFGLIRNPTGADDYAYKPVTTLLEIVSLGKMMQGQEAIYKGFIKETT